MEHRYTKLLEGLREMEDVRAKNPDRLKPVLDQGAGAALTECVATIADTAVSQGAHRNGRSGERREELRLANRLRAARIKRVVEVARLVVPEATQLDVLRMPPGNLNPTELASRALELAQTCDPYLPQLIAGGLPPDGLTQLRAAASELLASGAAKANHRRLQVNATDTLDTTVALVRRVIRSADSLVKSAIEDATDPVRQEWDTAVSHARSALSTFARQSAAAVSGGLPAPATPAGPAAATAQAGRSPAAPVASTGPVLVTDQAKAA